MQGDRALSLIAPLKPSLVSGAAPTMLRTTLRRENVWYYLRANKLSLLVWDGYEAIVTACKEAWDFLIGDPDRIKSIGSRSWACVGT
jgi:hypothetical protein